MARPSLWVGIPQQQGGQLGVDVGPLPAVHHGNQPSIYLLQGFLYLRHVQYSLPIDQHQFTRFLLFKPNKLVFGAGPIFVDQLDPWAGSLVMVAAQVARTTLQSRRPQSIASTLPDQAVPLPGHLPPGAGQVCRPLALLWGRLCRSNGSILLHHVVDHVPKSQLYLPTRIVVSARTDSKLSLRLFLQQVPRIFGIFIVCNLHDQHVHIYADQWKLGKIFLAGGGRPAPGGVHVPPAPGHGQLHVEAE